MATAEPETESSSPRVVMGRQDRLLHHVLLGALVAMLTATPFLPSDAYSIAAAGEFAAPAMLWLLLAACGAAVWLLRAVRLRDFSLSFSYVDAALALFFIWVAVAGALASADGNRRAGWNMTASWVGLGCTYYLARSLFIDGRAVRALLLGVALFSLLFSAEGLYEAWVEIPAEQARFEKNPAAVMTEAGLDAVPGAAIYEQFKSRLLTKGPSATFALENSFAGFLIPGFLLLFMIPFARGKDASEGLGLFRIAILVASLVIIAICLRYTHSQAAMVSCVIALAIGAASAFLPKESPLGKGAWCASLVLMAILFLWPIAIGLIGAGAASRFPLTLKYRAEYWQSCAALLRDHFLLGCGPGNFQDLYSLYKLPQASETIADPHNFLWEVLCNSGAAAGLLFLIALGAAALPLLRRTRSENPSSPPTLLQRSAAKQPFSLRPLLIGGALGPLLALLLSLSSSSSFLLSFFGTLLQVGAIAAGLLFFALRGWVLNGKLSPRAMGLLWLALAIHFTVSGGVANPATGTLFFLLLALLQVEAPQRGWRWENGAPFGAAILLLFVIGGIAHYQWGYIPVLGSQAGLARAEIARLNNNRSEERNSLKEAAEADPWAVSPLHQLAQIELQQYLRDARETRPNADALLAAAEAASLRSPKSPALQYELALLLLRAYLFTTQGPDRETLVETARIYLEKTVQLAPTKAAAFAYLAYAQAESGDRAAAAQSAAEALRLDALNPHEQYDLAREPSPVPGRSFPGWLRDVAGQSASPPSGPSTGDAAP